MITYTYEFFYYVSFRFVFISVLHVANFKYVKPGYLPSVQNKRIYFNINTGLELYCLQLAVNLSFAFNRKKKNSLNAFLQLHGRNNKTSGV